MSKSVLSFGSLLLVGMMTAASNTAYARDFTYAGWGGGLQETQRDVYLKKYAEKTGKPFKEDVYLGGWASFEVMMAAKNITWDIVNVESGILQRGCDEGAFAAIDYERLGLSQDDFVPGTASECGVGSYTYAFALAYDTDVTGTEPTGLADLWDLERWPGKRGMRRGPTYNLELALLADGVDTSEIYSLLSTPEGVDRAFAKLDQIKSEVIWWEAPAQAVDLLASSNVVLTIAPNARISAAAKNGRAFKVVYNPGMVGTDFWVIPEGTPLLDEAYEFLSIATTTANQAEFSTKFAYAPTLKAAAGELPAEAVAILPVGDAVAHALDISSPEATNFWANNADSLTERWNAWLVK